MTSSAAMRPWVSVLIAMTFLGVARAQEESERVRELQATIERLERRLEKLEKDESKVVRLEARIRQLEAEKLDADREGALETAINTLGGQEAGGKDFRVDWQRSLRFRSNNRNFRLQFGGRIQNDWTFVSVDDELQENLKDEADGVEIRRARLYVSGTFYDNVVFKLQVDFASGAGSPATLKDVYIGHRNIPVIGKVLIGHFKEPFGLEELTSSKYNTFMERATPNTFTPGRNNGIMLTNTALDRRLTWAVGVFRDSDAYGDSRSTEENNQDSKYSISLRVTGLPWFEEDGRRLLHLGGGFTWRNPDIDFLRFRQQPEAHLLKNWVDTGIITFVEEEFRYNFETAVVFDSFHLQAEVYLVEVERKNFDDLDFWGWYVEAGYFITGEHRRYNQGSATFDRPKVNAKFLDEGGAGAWQIALRYAYSDLSDRFTRGGQIETISAAVNWWLNPATRITFNYVFAEVTKGPFEGEGHIFMIRFQVEF